jgi:hypothetical protein
MKETRLDSENGVNPLFIRNNKRVITKGKVMGENTMIKIIPAFLIVE